MKLNELTKEDLETIKEKALQLAVEDYRKEFEKEKQLPKQMPDFMFKTIEKSMQTFCYKLTQIIEENEEVSLAQFVSQMAVAVVYSIDGLQEIVISQIAMKCFSEFFLPILEEYGIN